MSFSGIDLALLAKVSSSLKVKVAAKLEEGKNRKKKKKMNPSASSGGLVRRRTAVETNADNNGSNSSTSNNDHNDNFKDDADNDNMEETSDKETRLTLMEEVLLLGLKDKEVSISDVDLRRIALLACKRP